ncbi:hypothetical protein CVT25_008182 [Psilocybe cyanescens]|uniref:C3H1-type domain-containing protein n=1 Tax=Psilocybe cyanescens TaxID=93625 RepID=A0A409X9K2_PSICY|nr:hypothetical protein CVT25_008182 [Psilocybe cyanescens]
MSFGLTIGTDRAQALQDSIQDELTKRGYSVDADPVMAEYITIMVINNKTAAQVTSELEDIIGADFNPDFTEWIFAEAAKGATAPDAPPQSPPPKAEPPVAPTPAREAPPHIPNDSSRPNPPRNGVYQHAISQALPSASNSSQKRTASARSPSPSHPNKSRRTDLPTGPRAMYRDGSGPNGNPHPNTRSLIERVGGPAGRNSKNFQRDDIQARIDNIIGNSPESMMMPPNFPMGMDMNAMAAANMANPLMLQEMMMNQMALMAQMASSMGIINPANGQFGGPGFPMQGMQGMPGDMGMFQNNMNNGFPQQQQQQSGNNGPVNGAGRGRGGVRGGRGTARGRGGPTAGGSDRPIGINKPLAAPPNNASTSAAIPIVAPTPISPAPSTSAPSAAARTAGPAVQTQPAYTIPERPQSPTLCKFSLKCTNAHCRYSHPSPVATAESGVVLSNEACDKGKNCKDKDCIKAHVSPAVLNPQVEHSIPNATVPTPQAHHNSVACRFGAACTRPGCTFNHPPRQTQFATQCRFGAACTRAQCAFQHPEGRVLPSTFHRGLSTTGPIVSVPTPETGSMSGASQNRSMTFNNPSTAAKQKLEQQMKEVEERKNKAEQAVKDAEAAANSKKADANPVSITA